MPPSVALSRRQPAAAADAHVQVLTANDCEGAGEIFDAVLPPPAAAASAASAPLPPFFGIPMHLSVSAQLHAEAAACALGRVYSFGPTFRAENSNTPRHLAEFWMLEPEVRRASHAELSFDADLPPRATIPPSLLTLRFSGRARLHGGRDGDGRAPHRLLRAGRGKCMRA
jgi:hypothetical protein